jgi:hypothetical protein
MPTLYVLLLLAVLVMFFVPVTIALVLHVGIKATLKIPLALVSFETKEHDSDE